MAKAPANTSAEYAARLLLYEKLVATNSAVERKGATMPYTSLNGNMFSMLEKNGTLALRLPSPEREAFIARYQTKLIEMHGVTMAEYVAVPDALLAKTSELKPFFDVSIRYVATLKPKATTRPKKSGASKPAKIAKPAGPANAVKSTKSTRARKSPKATTRAKR